MNRNLGTSNNAKGSKKQKSQSSSKRSSSKRSKQEASSDDANVLTSFFYLELQTTNGNPDEEDIVFAVDLLVESYNDLLTNYEDPFDRRMETATVESIPHGRRTTQEVSTRKLQNLNILLFLRISGSCRGCGSNPFFTNQAGGRRKLFEKNVSDDLQPGVPTEEALLAEYSARLNSENIGSIVDAVRLEEVSEAISPAKGKGRSSKKSYSASSKSAKKGSYVSDSERPDTDEEKNDSVEDVNAEEDEQIDIVPDDEVDDRDANIGDPIDIISLPTIQVRMISEHDDDDEKCMFYASGNAFLSVETCSSTGIDNHDHWEKMKMPNGLFGLRHKNTQKCIPQNPESPDSSFDCFASSGQADAIADRISGLVECSSPYAATMGFLDTYNPMYLYQEQCATGTTFGADADVILMTFVDNGSIIVLWGEKILLDLEGVVTNRGLAGNWYLSNVE